MWILYFFFTITNLAVFRHKLRRCVRCLINWCRGVANLSGFWQMDKHISMHNGQKNKVHDRQRKKSNKGKKNQNTHTDTHSGHTRDQRSSDVTVLWRGSTNASIETRTHTNKTNPQHKHTGTTHKWFFCQLFVHPKNKIQLDNKYIINVTPCRSCIKTFIDPAGERQIHNRHNSEKKGTLMRTGSMRESVDSNNKRYLHWIREVMEIQKQSPRTISWDEAAYVAPPACRYWRRAGGRCGPSFKVWQMGSTSGW